MQLIRAVGAHVQQMKYVQPAVKVTCVPMPQKNTPSALRPISTPACLPALSHAM